MQADQRQSMMSSRTISVCANAISRGLGTRKRVRLSGPRIFCGTLKQRNAGLEFTLLLIVGVTSCALAWIAIHWLPAYLAIMFLIFVLPDRKRLSSSGSSNLAETSVTRPLKRNEDSGVDCPAEQLSQDPNISSRLDGFTEGASSEFRGLSSGGPRRGSKRAQRPRLRTNRTSKSGLEPTFENSAAAWIQVGPGRFVRAESNMPNYDQAQPTNVAPNALENMATLNDMRIVSSEIVEGSAGEGEFGLGASPPEPDGVPMSFDNRGAEVLTQGFGTTPADFEPRLAEPHSGDDEFDDHNSPPTPGETKSLQRSRLTAPSAFAQFWLLRPGSGRSYYMNSTSRFSAIISSLITKEKRRYSQRALRSDRGHRNRAKRVRLSRASFTVTAHKEVVYFPRLGRVPRSRSPPLR
jgi:hypothetical protein